MPITQTTRKTLLKKLKNFMESANENLQKKCILVKRFSSDEETSSMHLNKIDSYNRLNSIVSNENKNKFSNNFQSDRGNAIISPVMLTYEGSSTNNDLNQKTHVKNDDEEWNEIYTKRLLQLRKNNMLKSKRATLYDKKYEGRKKTFMKNIFHYFGSLFRCMMKNFYAANQSKFVPILLTSALIIFFVFIIFLYINISNDIEKDINITFKSCNTINSNSNYRENACINSDDSDIDKLLGVIRNIRKVLQKRSNYKCTTDHESKRELYCANDLYGLITHQQTKEISESEMDGELFNRITSIMKDIRYIIQENTFLGIETIKILENVKDSKAVGINFDFCFALISQMDHRYCSLYIKIQKYFMIIGSLALISFIGIMLFKALRFLWKIRENHESQVNKITEDIIKYVLENTVDDNQKHINIDDMKDSLFFINSDVKKTWAWNKAITYLEKNDSRVQFGYENNVQGKDIKIIRRTALGNNCNEHSTLYATIDKNIGSGESKPKKWITPAFDTNKIKDPPTNCLKIRHMIDKFEINTPNILSIVQDTIMLKIENKKCKINDIQLDKKTCCVYVKCKTCADAGVVHQEMNGWWLDQRLIVVKFLREDKFNQRFPSSSN